MKKIGFGFSKMNQDTSAGARKPEDYYDALNMINTPTEDNVLGGIMSDKGNALQVRIPNIVNDQLRPGTFYTTYDTTVSQLPPSTFIQSYPYTNLQFSALPILVVPQIIGQVEHKEFIYFVTTGSTGTPTGTNDGQVWRYNTTTQVLDLVYHGFLNLSIDFPITGIHFIEETESNQRLYFIDHHNQLQVMNVNNPDVFNLPATAFKIIGDTTLYAPTFVQSNTFGYFQSGLVCYAYQLYNSNGTTTRLSPLSDIININEKYTGITENEYAGINLELSISNLSSNYSGIRVYRVHYINPDQEPLVHLIEEIEYVSTNTVSFIDDGQKNIVPYSLQELLYLFNRTVFTGRALTTKDNHMFIGNLKEFPYLPDYDARAYRFNSAGVAQLRDRQGNIFTVVAPTATVPKDHDAINPSNGAETLSNAAQPSGFYTGAQDLLYNQYIYQANGSTIGGEGPNVSYTFITQNIIPKSPLNAISSYSLSNQSYANPGNYNLRGYKRDEIYRFGIILFNKYMQASPVEWIGDIRFPATDDPNGSFELTEQSYNNNEELKVLGIQFRVVNLPSDCIGYQIVRVPRTRTNRTCISQALVQPMMRMTANNRTADIDMYDQVLEPSIFLRGLYTLPANFYNIGTIDHRISLIPWNDGYDIVNNALGLPGTQPIQSTNEIPSSLFTAAQYDKSVQLYSPEIEYLERNFSPTSNVYIKTVGAANIRHRATYWYNGNADDIPNYYNYFLNLFYQDWANLSTTNRQSLVWVDYLQGVNTSKSSAKVIQPLNGDLQFTQDSQKGDQTNYIPEVYDLPGVTAGPITEYTDKILFFVTGSPTGSGTRFTYVADNNTCMTMSVSSSDPTLSQPGFYANIQGAFPIDTYLNKRDLTKIPIVDIKSLNTAGIYGGNTYEARTNNSYITVSEFVPNISTVSVYNGDIFLSYWAFNRIGARIPYLINTSQNVIGTARNLVIVPIESTINVDLRTDDWKSDINKLETTLTDSPIYNDVYSYEPSNFKYSPLLLNYKPNTKFDYRLVASNSKVYGEYLDNWSVYEFNQVMDLDPARGHISNLHRLQEEVIAIQSQGISLIKINPEITVTSNEGSQIELAQGTLLYSSSYIDRTSGVSTTFGSAELPGGILLVDDLNKKVKLLSGQGNNVISDIQGISSYLRKNVDFDLVRLDNPYKNTGISIGYYPDKQMMYLTFNLLNVKSDLRPQPDNSFTLGYSFLMQGFTSRYSFTPSAYVSSLGRLYSIPDDNKSLWKHEVGLYANYYGTQYESSISLFGAAEGLVNSTWDNLSYTGRLLDLNNNDIYDESFTSIRVYNEHQDSGIVSLVPFQNQRHRDRKWNIGLPRVQGSRARISNPWAIMELSYLGDGTKRIIVDSANATYRLYPSSYI